jgi:hypothetical protein
MSKLIEQLAKEHHFVHEFMTVGQHSDALQKYKKFGELIVRECIQFIEEENVRLCEYQNSLPEWDGNKRDDCDLVIEKCIDLAERMGKYFGVDRPLE